MDAQLFLLCVLTFVIHLIGALAYAVRIAGVRTRRIAMSFALFNVLVLLSRARTGGSTAPAALGTVFVPDR